MKLSVSLPQDDVEYLDTAVRERSFPSRSAVLHRAVQLLRSTELADDYASAWAEWDQLPEADEWQSVTGDGFGGD